MSHFTIFSRMGRQQLLFCIVTSAMLLFLAAGAFIWFPHHAVHADTALTGSVNWSSLTGKKANLQYGLNAYNGYDPVVQANATYQNNVASMQPGIVRWHYGGQMNDSSSDRSGWIVDPTGSSYHWDTAKINRALSVAFSSTGAFRYSPVKLMDIVNWPAYLDDGKGHLRADAYDEYARFCAQLVKIINVDGKYNFKYFEVFNEIENGGGSAYDHNMTEAGRIYNKAARAMKAVDPGIKVGGPAFARPDLAYNLDDFFAIAAPNLDFVSYHSYSTGNSADSNQQIWNAADIGWVTNGVRSEFQKYTTRSIDYLHDEYNISWNPPDQKMTAITGGIFDALAVTSLVNNGASGGMAWNEGDGWYGKLDSSYNRRPASYLYEYLNKYMQGDVVSALSSDTHKVVIMAVTNGNKDAVMLINRSESDQSIKLAMSGLASGITSDTQVTSSRMSASGGSIGSVTIGTLSNGYTLPANTVTILSFQGSKIAIMKHKSIK